MSVKSFEQIIDQISNLSVIELSELIKALEVKFGVSAQAVAAAPAAATTQAAAAPAAEKSEYKVTLKEAGANKVNVIKALREVTTLSIIEAKNAVENAPTVIAEAATKDNAKKMQEKLEAAGAKVELA